MLPVTLPPRSSASTEGHAAARRLLQGASVGGLKVSVKPEHFVVSRLGSEPITLLNTRL